MNKLVELLESERPAYPETPYDIGYNNGLTMAIAIVGKLELEEVVRCKDCKYYTHANQSAHWNEKALACFRKARISVKPDDFCSYGERRNDG